MKVADLQRLIRTKASGKTLRDIEVLDAMGETYPVKDITYDAENDKVYIIIE